MNIYIYGAKGFKEEIHKTLEHANIKFKIDSDALIEDIDSLDELKEKIIQYPQDIYLIDESKIIKKSLLNQKIKLFTPKDAIEQEFLLENGVADVSVDSLEEIPRYIVKKYEEKSPRESSIEQSIIEIVDEAYSESENTIDLDDEISALLEPETKNSEFKEDVGLSNINSDYDDETTHEDSLIEEIEESNEFELEELEPQKNELDFDIDSLSEELKELDELDIDNNEDVVNVEDELDSLLQLDEDISSENSDKEEPNEDIISSLNEIDEDDVLSQALEIENMDDDIDDFMKELDMIEDLSEDSIENMDDLDSLLELDEEITAQVEEETPQIDENLEFSNEDNDKVSIEDSSIEEISKGEKMSQDEFAQLDSLNESDILSALEDIDSIPVPASPKKEEPLKVSSSNDKVEVSSSNVNDLAALISQLLNNKTLEITIKIKD